MYPVQLYIYDLSHGFADVMSAGLIGRHIRGIWHTSIVCYGQEYFYGGHGIESCPPGATFLGKPHRVHDLGHTQLEFDLIMEYLLSIGNDRYRPGRYHLFNHNCNTFSNEVAYFLTGNSIPSDITNLPDEVSSTPLGAMLKQYFESMMTQFDGGTPIATYANTHQQQTADTQNADKKLTSATSSNQQLPEVNRTDIGDSSMMQSEAHSHVKAKAITSCIVFSGDQIKFHRLKDNLKEILQPVDIPLTVAAENYLMSDNQCDDAQTERCATENLILILSALLNDDIASTADVDGVSTRFLTAASILTYMAVREYPVEKLCSEGLILKIINKFASVDSIDTRLEIVKMLCNLLATKPGLTFLVFNKTYSTNCNPSDCPAKIITSIVVCCLLNESSILRSVGATLMLNFALANPDEDIAFECATALIKMMQGEVDYTTALHGLSAISHLIDKNSDVIALVQVMMLDIEKFVSKYSALEDICRAIEERIA